MTTPQTELVYAGVGVGLLKSLPRMFTSFRQMLVELLQNCARAGATRVTVTYDPVAQTLEICDDGAGQADPRVLFTAGQSDWEERVEQTANPAGLGLFSVLAFASKVTYESRLASGAGWRVTATPEILTGVPAIVERLSGLDPELRGFTIKLCLSGHTHQMGKEVICTARALYPFKLTYQDADGAEELPPYRTWQPCLTVQTAYGQVDWSPRPVEPRSEFCREYQAKPSVNLKQALLDAAQKHEHAELAQAVVRACILWFVPDGDRVQVRLPDRSELIDNLNLRLAAKAITTALVEAVVEQARPIVERWPDRLKRHEVPQLPGVETPAWLHDGNTRHALLKLLGWHLVEHDDFDSTYVYHDYDGDVVETDRRGFYDKQAVPVSSRALAQTLNQFGVAAYHDPLSTRVRARAKGLKRNAEVSPYLALAEEIVITVDSQPLTQTDDGKPLNIRWLVTDSDGRFDWPGLTSVQACAIWIGSPAGLTEYLSTSGNGSHRLLNAILEWDYGGNADDSRYWEWIEGDSADREINHSAIAETLILQVSEAFQPRLARQRETYFRLEGALEATRAVASAADDLEFKLHGIPHPSARAFRAQVKRIARQLEQLERDLLRAKVAQGRKAGMPPPKES